MEDDDRVIGDVVRRMLLGAIVGAGLGILVGVVLHIAFGSGSSVSEYEVYGGLAGLVAGGLLGAFYGGGIALVRHAADGPPAPPSP